MANLALGIDVGTTAVKTVALDSSGRVGASASAAHDLLSPRPGWAEEHPDAWWANVTRTVREVVAAVPRGSLAAAGVSGMVPALLLLDDEDRVLRPSIQQNDARCADEVAWLAARLDAAALVAATGQPISQQLIPPRVLWLRRHEPEVLARTRRMMGSYDYVTFRLTGVPGVERNWALESGMWDARADTWYRPMLDVADIPDAWLPPLRLPHEVVGGVSREAAAATGLPEGLPVIAGSADHIGAALAAGIAPGDLIVKIGGGGDVLYALDRFAPDPRLYIDYHDVPGLFILNGCMATSGSLVKWLAATCARELGPQAYHLLDEEAAALPAGSEGLIVLPYFLGEKTPIFDPAARGVVFGLTLSHHRAHLHRAAMEAVAYGFRHHAEVLEAAGHDIRCVRIMDGGARSPLWRQIVADVLDRTVRYTPGADVGSAWGVAWVAGVAAGLWGWKTPAPGAGEIVHEPDPAAHRRYARLYALYRDLYERLRSGFAALDTEPE